MHYYTIALIPETTDVPLEVARVMAPYNEALELEPCREEGEPDKIYWCNPEGRWDWYQIGGRWTGKWDDYDPEEDPANAKPCFCRTSEVVTATCKICDGTGTRTAWPIEWQLHSGDICKAASLRLSVDQMPRALVMSGAWHTYEVWDSEAENHRMVYTDNEWTAFVKERLAQWDGLAVVVDYHS